MRGLLFIQACRIGRLQEFPGSTRIEFVVFKPNPDVRFLWLGIDFFSLSSCLSFFLSGQIYSIFPLKETWINAVCNEHNRWQLKPQLAIQCNKSTVHCMLQLREVHSVLRECYIDNWRRQTIEMKCLCKLGTCGESLCCILWHVRTFKLFSDKGQKSLGWLIYVMHCMGPGFCRWDQISAKSRTRPSLWPCFWWSGTDADIIKATETDQRLSGNFHNS